MQLADASLVQRTKGVTKDWNSLLLNHRQLCLEVRRRAQAECASKVQLAPYRLESLGRSLHLGLGGRFGAALGDEQVRCKRPVREGADSANRGTDRIRRQVTSADRP